MAIPKFFEFFRPVLQILENNQIMTVRAIRLATSDILEISPEDRELMLPSGKQRIVDNRVAWALSYLKKATLITSPATGKYEITKEGRKVIENKDIKIDIEFLNHYKSFQEFRRPKNTEGNDSLVLESEIANDSTPQDTMDVAYHQINDELANLLLQSIMERSPQFFERLVVDLLLAMGYGGAFEDAGVVIGKSGDEGIDGVIREDKLGFSNIYIQAKRWNVDTTIGRPEIQKFVGALAGQGAQKGLFITTARFSKESIGYTKKQLATKVMLIDGEKLTKLMIEYDIGVSIQNTYKIKRIDLDFFSDEND